MINNIWAGARGLGGAACSPAAMQPVGWCRQENRQLCVCAWLSLPFPKGTFNPVALLTLQTLILVLGFSAGLEQGGQEGGWIAQGCQGFAGATGAPSSSRGGGPRVWGSTRGIYCLLRAWR